MADPLQTRGTYRDGRIELEKPLPALAGLSLELSIAFPEGEGDAAAVQVRARYPGPLVELGADLAAMGQGEGTHLVKAVREFRRRLLEAAGFRLPSVRIVVREEFEPDAYEVRLHQKRIGGGKLQVERYLAFVDNPKDQNRLLALSRDIQPDPLFGLPSCWIRPAQQRKAEQQGLRVVAPATVLSGHVEELLAGHLPECLEREAVHGLIEAAREVSPRLVDGIVPARMSEGKLHGLLRTLLGLKRSIGPIQVVFEAIDEFSGGDDEALVHFVAERLPAFGAI